MATGTIRSRRSRWPAGRDIGSKGDVSTATCPTGSAEQIEGAEVRDRGGGPLGHDREHAVASIRRARDVRAEDGDERSLEQGVAVVVPAPLGVVAVDPEA